MTRKELADRTGVSYPYLTEIEGGKKMPSTRVIATIAEALGVRPHEFLRMAEEMAFDSRLASGEVDAALVDERVRPSRRYFHTQERLARSMATRPEDEDRRKDLQLFLYRLADDLEVDDLERLVELARRLGTR